eukprot:TRINITY_DN30144_c0_g1_i1.p1 TRINITY_DN30144_c0_g1~~TRINITY_DN30144_c0_g1_i1.p1  ORF type:complete len:163 (+),score=40.45 TRINITY_DN30144_c0_g1_i1:590-1078(+)
MSLDQGMRYNSGFNYHNQYLPQDHYGGQLSSFQNELNGLNLNRLLNEVREAPQQNQNFHSNDQFSSNFGTPDHFGSKFSNDLLDLNLALPVEPTLFRVYLKRTSPTMATLNHPFPTTTPAGQLLEVSQASLLETSLASLLEASLASLLDPFHPTFWKFSPKP